MSFWLLGLRVFGLLVLVWLFCLGILNLWGGVLMFWGRVYFIVCLIGFVLWRVCVLWVFVIWLDAGGGLFGVFVGLCYCLFDFCLISLIWWVCICDWLTSWFCERGVFY